MSKLILAQNNHFSKVCTILISKDSESIEGDPIIIEYIFTVVTTNYILFIGYDIVFKYDDFILNMNVIIYNMDTQHIWYMIYNIYDIW